MTSSSYVCDPVAAPRHVSRPARLLTKWIALAVHFCVCVAHVIVQALGLPVSRTLAFTVGFLAQAVLAPAIFKVL